MKPLKVLQINKGLLLEAINTPLALGAGAIGAGAIYGINKLKDTGNTGDTGDTGDTQVSSITSVGQSPHKIATQMSTSTSTRTNTNSIDSTKPYDPTKDPNNVQYEGPSQEFLGYQADRDHAHDEMLQVVRQRWKDHLSEHPDIDPLNVNAFMDFQEKLTDTIQAENAKAVNVDIDTIPGLV